MAKMRTAVVCGKFCTAPEGDYFVTCSFDPNHVLLRSRMPYHIIKCVKQHPDHGKIQCPYDATEYIDSEEFPDHVISCESRRSIFLDRYETAELKAAGNICNIKQTPFFHDAIPPPDEDWGAPQVKEDDEDLPIMGVGRGMSLPVKKKDVGVKKGMGRAELLNHFFKRYQEQLQASGSSESSDKENILRDNVRSGQFEDV